MKKHHDNLNNNRWFKYRKKNENYLIKQKIIRKIKNESHVLILSKGLKLFWKLIII